MPDRKTDYERLLRLQKLVKAMRGRLEVESREGLGSHFTVRIPASTAVEIFQSIADTEREQAS